MTFHRLTLVVDDRDTVSWSAALESRTIPTSQMRAIGGLPRLIRGQVVRFGPAQSESSGAWNRTLYGGSRYAFQASDFDLTTPLADRDPSGAAWDGETVWVADRNRGHVEQHTPAGGLSKAVIPATVQAERLSGLAYAAGRLITVSSNSSRVGRIIVATQTIDTTLDFEADHLTAEGVVADGEFAHILTADGWLRGYRLSDGARVGSLDVAVAELTVASTERLDGQVEFATGVRGVALDGDTLLLLLANRVELRSWQVVRSVEREAEASGARLAHLATGAGVAINLTATATRPLPAREVTGNLREAVRRVEAAEVGRLTGGQFAGHGRWAAQAGTSNAFLDLERDTLPVVTPQMYAADARLVEVDAHAVGQVTVTDAAGNAHRRNTAGAFRARTLSVDTDADPATADNIAAWYLERRATPAVMAELTIEAAQIDPHLAEALIRAGAHTPVWVDDPELGTGPWLVHDREITWQRSGDVISERLKFTLAQPRWLGVGWTTGGGIEEDRLYLDTVLV